MSWEAMLKGRLGFFVCDSERILDRSYDRSCRFAEGFADSGFLCFGPEARLQSCKAAKLQSCNFDITYLGISVFVSSKNLPLTSQIDVPYFLKLTFQNRPLTYCQFYSTPQYSSEHNRSEILLKFCRPKVIRIARLRSRKLTTSIPLRDRPRCALVCGYGLRVKNCSYHRNCWQKMRGSTAPILVRSNEVSATSPLITWKNWPKQFISLSGKC